MNDDCTIKPKPVSAMLISHQHSTDRHRLDDASCSQDNYASARSCARQPIRFAAAYPKNDVSDWKMVAEMQIAVTTCKGTHACCKDYMPRSSP